MRGRVRPYSCGVEAPSVDGRLVGDVHRRRALLAYAGRAGPVREDAEDPGLERGPALEAVDALQNGKPGVLRDLLGDRPARDEGLGETHHRRVVGVDELCEGGLVAGTQPAHEVVIAHAKQRMARGPSGGATASRMGNGRPEDSWPTTPKRIRTAPATGSLRAMPEHPTVDRSMGARLAGLEARRAEAINAGSQRSIKAHKAKGKMTARERIDYLLDEGSFQEMDLLVRHRSHGMGLERSRPYTDGVITGFGMIDGRRVCVFSQDFTVFGGALGEAHAEKIHKVMDLALSVGVPIIGLDDSGGARIQEGVVSLHSYGGIFYRNVRASGVVPQISVILGPAPGAPSTPRR